MGFIEDVAVLVQKYAQQYGICVNSPIIAQAILESACGTSNKVVIDKEDGTKEWRHNYLGLKYNPKMPDRCPSAIGFFAEDGSEQNADGSYSSGTMLWWKFDSLESCIKGYFEFISISWYSNLKGVTDPKKYIENIKADNYATSHDYVENVMNVVKKYDLTRFDNVQEPPEKRKLTFNIHAGHTMKSGAVGYLNESKEARIICGLVCQYLREMGHTVYDCTVNDVENANECLKEIVRRCNQHKVDIDVSIHLNAFQKETVSDGRSKGTEVWAYPQSSISDVAARVCGNISSIGLTNRGVKYSSGLYVLKNTKSPAMLIECCFVDDLDDVAVYDADKMARAIVKGLTGEDVQDVEPEPPITELVPTPDPVPNEPREDEKPKEKLFYVVAGIYRSEANAKAFSNMLAENGYLLNGRGEYVKGIVTTVKEI